MNYRHQADISHAYQIFHENGVPNSNIIVMMYDDIAYNPQNPFQGVIINRPAGPNVYKGVPKDYTGKQVNPGNFLAVLTGNHSYTHRKVLQSGPNDNVFIYFSDHGAPGLIAFPYSYLYAHDLIDALLYMHNSSMYKNLVFYLEACDSGSMFNIILPNNISIYAVTAATPNEDSWACSYDNTVEAYLNDCFSENWLINSDSYENDMNESLRQQYLIVRNETAATSTACHYGQNNMMKMPLKDFLIWNATGDITRQIRNKHRGLGVRVDAINSRDIKLGTLMRRYESAKRSGDKQVQRLLLKEIMKERRSRKFYDDMFKRYYTRPRNDLCHPVERIDTYCLQKHVEQFERKYGRFTDYGMKYIRTIGEMYCM